MSVTEKQRHDLFKQFEETFGPEHAATMMELLPPVGWADVATKHDLDALRVATKADLDLFRAEWRSDLDLFRAEWRSELGDVRSEVGSLRSDVDSLRAEVRSGFEALEHRLEARLSRSFMTWLLTGMGIQTGVVGLLVGLS